MHHELKIWPRYYHAVQSGEKTFEVRDNDRAFQKGDEVTLRFFDPEYLEKHPDLNVEDMRAIWDKNFEPMKFTIGFVLHLDGTRVVFSLLEFA